MFDLWLCDENDSGTWSNDHHHNNNIAIMTAIVWIHTDDNNVRIRRNKNSLSGKVTPCSRYPKILPPF